MGLIHRKRQKSNLVPQTLRSNAHPFATIGNYSPGYFEMSLYKELREAVPVIDSAILKIIRLTGGFKISCQSKRIESELNRFLKSVRVSGIGQGIDRFLSAYLSDLLTYGTSIGEIVTDSDGIRAVCNVPLKNVDLRMKENGIDVGIYKNRATFEEVSHPELIMLSALNPESGQVYGESLLKGLPFVSGILLNIYKTIGTNFERIGNLRFAVTYNPQGDSLDKTTARERAEQIASEWSKALSSPDGQVRDFVAVGDVKIQVIGADSQLPDTDIPVRHMLEQIITKTGLPPFLLGFSWSTTERMSSQQTDILTSELEYYRRILTPVIEQICYIWQRKNGYFEHINVDWDIINLQDRVELAKAELYEAQAENLRSQIKINDKEKEELS